MKIAVDNKEFKYITDNTNEIDEDSVFLLTQQNSKYFEEENYKKAIQALENDDYATAAEIALKYYDKAYKFGLSKRNSNKIIELELSSDSAEIAAKEIIEFAKKSNLI